MKTFTRIIALISFILINVQLFAQTESGAVVAADKMNILYIGIDNPVSVAVPGLASDKLKVSINNGTITGNNGKYIVKVDKPIETIIEITTEIKPGEIKKVGSSSFRVMRVPDPTAVIANYLTAGYSISKTTLLKNPQIDVRINLPFELKFEIISFTLSYKIKDNLITEATTGNKFNQKMIDEINTLVTPCKLYIEDIKVKGPDGATRNLGSIIINLIDAE